MPFSIKRFTMHRSTSLPGGRTVEGKKVSLTEIREHLPTSRKKSESSSKSKSSSNIQHHHHHHNSSGGQSSSNQIPNSRSMDVAELRRTFGDPSTGPPPELLTDSVAPGSTLQLEQQRRVLHSIQEYPSRCSSSRGTRNSASLDSENRHTLPAKWRNNSNNNNNNASGNRGAAVSESRGIYSEVSSTLGPGGTELRRLVVRKNGVRFQETDWRVENLVGVVRGGNTAGRGVLPHTGHSSDIKSSEWDDDLDSGHLSDALPRGSQSLKRIPQASRRHHHADWSNMTLPRPSLDLESHLPNQRSHSLYQPPPSSVYDDDPGIMSEVETSATGFRRGSKARSSLPIVRTPSKTQERPLGLVFLQYQSETKRALLPNEITSMDTVKALFVRSFPKQLTMEYLDSPHIRVYIHDPAKDMFYELEELRDIRDRSVLRIYEQDMNGEGMYSSSTYDQDLSYFSEPEFDSEYQHQHIHRSKVSKNPGPPTVGYYGTLPAHYLSSNRTQTLPHSASMRAYAPAVITDRQKSQTLPPGGGTSQPPPKPQRSFQQTLTPLGKAVRSTPPPTGPPPSVPSPRSSQSRALVPVGSSLPMSPERRTDQHSSYRSPPERPYSVAGQATYHISPERRYDPSYHSSPERRSQPDSGYLSSPERRIDHNRAFSTYQAAATYEDSVYGGSLYGTRSGSVTPVIDEEARMRMEYMERQLASLTGLVQKALTPTPKPLQPIRDAELNKHVPSSQVNISSAVQQVLLPGEIKFTIEMQLQLRQLRKQAKDLRLEVRNLRRIAQSQSVTARDTVRETCVKIKSMLSAAQMGEDQVCAERLRVSREEDLYKQDVTKLEKDLTELETHVEDLRSNVINRRCRVNMSDVEGMALVLSRASKTVADLKARFPNLQDSLKSVMAAEMEVVVREEKFLKEEPDRLETALRRCKKLTGTLVTLKRLASVQEQRHTGSTAHPTPEKSSAEGNHSDGEDAHSAKAVTSDPHTVIHVPADGNQRGSRTENALDALLDELQTFTKPLEQPRDNIPGLLGPQRRLPSYPSADSPVRTPTHGFAANQNKVTSSGSSAFHTPSAASSGKLQVNDNGQKHNVNLSPSHSPISGIKKESADTIIRVAVNPGGSASKQTIIDGIEGTVSSNTGVPKKAPPPPPPRTTSKSPMTSPTTEQMQDCSVPNSPRDVAFSQMRSNSAPAGEIGPSVTKRPQVPPRSVSKDEGTDQKENDDLLRTSAISDDSLRREQLSSNSSSSESVNSQEGLQVSLQSGNDLHMGKLERKSSVSSDNGTPNKSKKLGATTSPRSRQEVLEQRHQELLRKQKQLQDQYARLQQLQRGQILQRFSPPRSATSTPVLSDLKKTGSESNILSKTAFSLTPSSGSLTHLAGSNAAAAVTSAAAADITSISDSQSAKVSSTKAPMVPAKPFIAQTKNKIYETDIL